MPNEFASYPSLKGRSVIVTGGASGIGEQIVAHFAQQGSRVVFLDVQDKAGEELVRSLPSRGHENLTYQHCDLTDLAALRSCMEKIIQDLGSVDVLVNNAANDQRHATEDVTPEYWDRCIAVNVRHQFFAAQAVIPAMKKAGRGCIINMSSISWMIPATGMPVYVTAKAGIVGLTRTLSRELGPCNIRVNAVLPGAILTDRQKRLWYTPEYGAEILERQALKRHLSPDEIARLVLFLASDDSSAITGQSYIADGGWM